MCKLRLSSFVKLIVTVFTVSILAETMISQEAFARAGRGRSTGRSFGSFRRSAPPPNNSFRSNQPVGSPVQGGGFMRGLAGGLAGGFLGSMLFSSLGHAAGFGPGMGGGGGGMGFLEILLLAGAGYFLYRWWRGRQQQQHQQPIMAYTATQAPQSPDAYRPQGSSYQPERLPAAGINPEEASDIFFRVQGAWTRRDLASVAGLLGSDIARIFAADIAELKSRSQINRLENITVRQTEVLDTWHEDGIDYSRVRFLANLLDYVVDEQTGRVYEGSDAIPVKFEENWIFANTSNGWQLVGIDQV